METYTIDNLIQERPSLHRHGDGKKANWGLANFILKYIYETTKPEHKTIEIGAGLSTVAFALAGSEHYSVFPEAYLKRTIPDYLDKNDVSSKKLHLIQGESQTVLPTFEETGFDMALIDGEHSFPIPFLDWYYLGQRLKPGGILIIDDTQIWTGQMLRNFLLLEPEWRLINDFFGTAVFKMETPWKEKWWAQQAYTVLHSQITPDAVEFWPGYIKNCLSPIFEQPLKRPTRPRRDQTYK